MKINSFGSQGVNPYKQQMNKIDQVSPVNKQKDKVEISSTAKEMQQVSQLSAQRQSKVEDLKLQVENGTYKVDAKETAKSILNFYSKN
ncbi:flagellar biosynthesis anti-sigma factor FlgM [Neobacillus sp. PS3-40]|uniref:flagellar biosynthesis anti-sigma factor FlgM n=1 Tax=Neobacillus sp. PS3-40 TaxID=3070679 RepID=UPI0027E1B555|nr:flagellar biosynthesis anti-sigma factor FlgM [Neobacillus sp. PS3-40]WML46092.1 flagellar biosynthesis anti-sigma factor FlgM [Neobacillus sp. PS3-40]